MKKIVLFTIIGLFNYFSAFSQVQQTNGPTGGAINCIDKIDNVLIAGTIAGMFKSENYGESWSFVESLHETVLDVLIKDDLIFAATWQFGYISSDLGLTWTKMNINGLTTSTQVTEFISHNNKIFAACSFRGVYCSSDNGQTWTKTSSGIPSNSIIYSLVSDGTNIFAGTENDGIYKSSDNGASWSFSSPEILYQNVFCMGVNNNIIYAGTSSGLYISENSGSNWEYIYIGIDDTYITDFYTKNDTIYITTPYGVYYSLDDVHNWHHPYTELAENVEKLSLFVDENKIYLGTNGKGIIVIENNGENSYFLNNLLIASNIYDLTFVDETIYAAAEANGTIFSSIDNGNTWDNVNYEQISGVSSIMSLGSIADNLIFSNYAEIMLSPDGGTTWINVNNGIPNDGYVYKFYTNNNDIFAGIANALYKSTDGGYNWEEIFTNEELYDEISSISIAGDTILIGTSYSNTIFQSNDYGETWTDEISTPFVYGIQSLIKYHENIFITTYESFYSSSDNGSTWSNYEFEDDYLYKNSMVMYDDIIFVSTETKIYYSKDLGKNWLILTDAINGQLYINNNFLYIGSTRGVWYYDLAQLPVTNNETYTSDFEIYPNPAKNILNIKGISLNSALSIYDLSGKVILNTTNYNNQIDINSLNQGAYILKTENKKPQIFIKE